MDYTKPSKVQKYEYSSEEIENLFLTKYKNKININTLEYYMYDDNFEKDQEYLNEMKNNDFDEEIFFEMLLSGKLDSD